MLAFILKSPSLHQSILTEIAPAFRTTTTPASDHIFNHTPQLEAIFLEVLRLMDFPDTTRTVISDTVIGKKKLRAGAKLLILTVSCTWTRKPLAPQPHPSTRSASSETKPWPVVQAIGLLAEARRSVWDVFLPNRRF